MKRIIEISNHITKVMLKLDSFRTVSGESIVSEENYETVQIADREEEVVFLKNEEVLISEIGYTFEEKDIYRYQIPKSKDELEVRMTIDGERSFLKEKVKVKTGTSYKASVSFRLTQGEAIYGLGQQENGIYNYRNVKEYLYQNNMKIPMPIFLSSKGYAVYFDSDCLMTYKEADNEMRIGFDATDGIVYYIISGDNFDALISGFRELTGKASMMPIWAYGYVQSKERYVSEKNILETAGEFEKRKIPVSCMVLDWCSWEEGKWGNKLLDKSRFPHLKEMTDTLHKDDIAFMVSIWPNMKEGCENHTEMMEAGKLYANMSTYDAFDAEARDIYFRQMKEELLLGGTDAWWCDSTEPFTPDWNGSVKLSDKERYELTKESLATYMDAKRANTYALAHARGIYEHQRAYSDKKRVVNLTRSGAPGIQSVGAILWSGDIMANWDVLKNQVAEGISMCMSGIPYWTLDIGAFFTGSTKCRRRASGKPDDVAPWFYQGDYEDGVSDLGYRELYTRWLQFGCFLPVMRSHGTDTPREPWNFGDKGDVYYDTITSYIDKRYEMLPYSYSLGAKVSMEDYTIMRSLMFDFSSDENVKNIATEFMYGPAYLVCPVVVPMEYGPNSKKLDRGSHRYAVYLPKGSDWYHEKTKELYAGGQYVEVEAPTDWMPVFIREGAMIPLQKEKKEDGSAIKSGLADTIEIYEGRDASFDYYIDNGHDYAFEKGEYTRIRFLYSDKDKKLTSIVLNDGYPIEKRVLTAVLYQKDGKVKTIDFKLEKQEIADFTLK